MRETRSACSGWSSTIKALPIELSLGASSAPPDLDRPTRPTLMAPERRARAPGREAGRSRDVQLDDVGVVQLVIALDGLAIKDPRAPDAGRLQRVPEFVMDLPGQVQDGAADGQCERPRPIGRLARDFRVDSQHSQ